METKVVTGKVRFSYCHVFEAHAIEDGETPKFSVCLLIDKKDKKTLAKVKEAIEAAKEASKTKWGGKIPAKLKLPLRDGDEERPDSEEFEGMYFINANSARRPGVVDEDLNEIIDKNEFYSGCYGRASVNFYGFSGKQNGIACGLNNLQKLEDGEPLGANVSSAEDDFGNDDDLL